ncbi:PAS domain S-box protein [Methylobacterium sp. Leaf106]|uniref:PAS domain S-box protein n=1 Tax=Methylobacterium sp. Leaf106 TaxID=1736255 RepID=UPI0006F6A13D|nr:PAS domain S-box protein [Methylobacterium sp. Leaf106]KQP41864.1 PAS domain S-box protein [Methylobacterium sp. Leaf106]
MITPSHEAERVAALHGLGILDTPPEEHYEAVSRTAKRLFGVEKAYVALIDSDRQWIKSDCDLASKEMPRLESFCHHTIAGGDMLVVPDARLDPRFAGNPLVTGPDPIVFYAGVPLCLESGFRVGSFCLIHSTPRPFSAEDEAALHDLAATVTAHLRLADAHVRLVREAEERAAHQATIADQREELQQRQSALASAHHLLAMAEEVAGIGHWRVRLADGQTFWSTGIYGIAGLDPATSAPTFDGALDLHHPDDRELVRSSISDALERKGAFAFEARMVRPNGEVRTMVVRGICECDVAGLAVGLVGTAIDVTDARNSDAALRERTSQFRRLVDAVSDCAFVTLDRTGHVANWNSGAERITGYSAKDAIGRHVSRFYTREGLEAGAPRIALATAAYEGRLKFECWRVRRDGSQFFASVAIDAIRDDEGAVVGYAEITRDITERRAAELELQRSEDRYRTLAEALPALIWTTRPPDGTATYVNPAFTDFYGDIGPQRSERTARNHPDDAERMEVAWRNAHAWGRTFTVEGRLCRHDGVYRWHKIVMIPIPTHDDRAPDAAEWLGTALDIDDIITARQRLEETTDLLRIAQDAADAGTWDLDLWTDTITLSPKAVGLFGLPCEGARAMPVQDWIPLVHPDDRQAVREEAANAIRNRTNYVAEYRIVVDAEERWISTCGRVLYDAAGAPYRMVGLHFDITERKTVEAALQAATVRAEQASAAKSEFLAAMSHEIRTPLNSILGYADLLLEEPSRTPDDRHRLELIGGAGAALLTIVNDVLDFSKIEAGQFTLELLPFPLRDLIENTVEIVRGSALKSPVTILSRLDPALPPWALGDANRLRQVLLNLLNNAVKFTPAGSVTLNVRQCGEEAGGPVLRFEVVDTGIGISEEEQIHLFQRFSQVDSSISRRFGGTGLGLAICRRLVSMMDGEIGVTSRPGEGSTFWFTLALPRAEAASGPAEAGEGRVVARSTVVPRPVRILVAEDVPVNQTLARAVLELAGHSVDVVGNGAEAVAAIQAHAGGPLAFDLVLMDVQMPGMDGLAATRLIRALPAPACAVPIIAMTANVLPEKVASLTAAGMDDHVGKPFKRDALYAAIARWSGPVTTGDAPALPTILDLEVYESLRDMVGPERATVLLSMLADELIDRFGSSPQAVDLSGMEPADLAYDAHVMVSAAGLLGFVGLSDLCREIETACRNGDDLALLVQRLVVVRDGTLGTIRMLQAA